MTISKKLIENVEELRKSLNEISVYDFDVYTSMELYYKIANKLNEVIKELMRFEGLVSDEVVEQNEKLIYLLGEGLNIEVVNKINQMVQDGTIDSILNHKLFESLNNKINSLDNIKISRNETGVITNAMLSQEVKESMTGGNVAVVGKDSVLAENIVDKQVTMNKLLIDYDFFPKVLTFKRRTYGLNSQIEIIEGATNLSSNLIYINDDEELILRFNETKFLCVIRLFNINGNHIVDRDINTDNYNLSNFFKEKQSDKPLCYAIYVKHKDGSALEDSYINTLSSYVYIENLRKKPLSIDSVENIYQDKKNIFNESNFNLNLINVNKDMRFYLESDISTSIFHKWFAYLNTDRTRKIHRFEGTFFPIKKEGQFRMFIEGSDKRNLTFNFQTKNIKENNFDLVLDVYQFSSFDGSNKPIISDIVHNTSITLPYEPCKIDLIVEGKIINVYVNSKFTCTYNGNGYLNENINRCGINFRGNKNISLEFSDLKVSYQQDKIINYTIDDVYELLTGLNNIESDNLFDDPTFKTLKDIHDKYGLKITLFLFYSKSSNKSQNLNNITTKFKKQFKECSSWLKFGYHSKYDDTYSSSLTIDDLVSNIETVYSAISKFACEDSISKFTRFGFFNVSHEQLKELRKRNLILGVFTADDNRESNCGLTGGQLEYMQKYSHFIDLENDIHYFRTLKRFDNYSKQQVLDALYTQYEDINNNSFISCFAHSIKQAQLEGLGEFVNKRNDLNIDFVENRV